MTEAKEIKKQIHDANRIVITSHKSPDGDSIGCSLGLYEYIVKLGKDAVICHPDACPEFLEWSKNNVSIIDYESSPDSVAQYIKDADLIFSLDYNNAYRLGNEMGNLLNEASAFKIMIDHHPNPDEFVDLSVSYPIICSTAQLIAEIIISNEGESFLDARIGTPLYLGIMTDTGSFRYPSVDARTHEIIAQFIRAGVNHSMVHENTYDGNRLDKIKLRSHILAEHLEIVPEYNVAVISAPLDVMHKFNFIKGDTEGLVNVALSVEGVKMAAFFSEKEDGIKISFRGKGDRFVNELASDHFSGGGHKYASGGISKDSLKDTIERFKNLLPDYY